jgi:hypothetical protein
MRTIPALVLAGLLALSLHCTNALGAPETGWWWNPGESGRGFFVESDGEITFIGAYLYDADGNARWLVSGSPNSDPYNYSGELFSLRSGQTLFGNYVAPVGRDNVGTITVRFTDDTHGVVTWPGGTVAIERQIFRGPETPAFQPVTGWWWNPDESGTGFSLEVQGNNLFVVGFMYEEVTGRPVWYFSAGPMASPTRYQGRILQFANGQTIDGPYRPPNTPVEIGTLDIEFTASDAATLTFTESAPASAAGFNARPIVQQAKKNTRTVQPQFPKAPLKYEGQFVITLTVAVGATANETFSGTMMWEKDLTKRYNFPVYFPVSGSLQVTYKAEVSNSVGATCDQNGVRVFDAASLKNNLALSLAPLGQEFIYDLEFKGLGRDNLGPALDVQVTTTCYLNGSVIGQFTNPQALGEWSVTGTIRDQVRSPLNVKVKNAFYENVSKVQNGNFLTGTVDFVPR